jgi:cell wall assembly regulator SMI1
MDMKMRKTGVPLTGETISGFEAQLKMQLPKDYRDFMLSNNGGTPEEDWVFDFIEAGDSTPTSSVIRKFLSISDEYSSIGKAYARLVNSKEISPNLLPIAGDPGGNYIFLSVSGEDCGKIYFGDHEIEDSNTGFIALSLVADSFSNFLENFYIED